MPSQTRTRSPEEWLVAGGGRGYGMIRTVPVGDVLVGNSGGDIKHDDAALSVDVVPVSQTAKLLLTRSVPYVKLDLSEVLGLDQLCCWEKLEEDVPL